MSLTAAAGTGFEASKPVSKRVPFFLSWNEVTSSQRSGGNGSPTRGTAGCGLCCCLCCGLGCWLRRCGWLSWRGLRGCCLKSASPSSGGRPGCGLTWGAVAPVLVPLSVLCCPHHGVGSIGIEVFSLGGGACLPQCTCLPPCTCLLVSVSLCCCPVTTLSSVSGPPWTLARECFQEGRFISEVPVFRVGPWCCT